MSYRLYCLDVDKRTPLSGKLGIDQIEGAYEFVNGAVVTRDEVDEWIRDTGFKINRMKHGTQSYHFIFPNEYEYNLFRVRFGA